MVVGGHKKYVWAKNKFDIGQNYWGAHAPRNVLHRYKECAVAMNDNDKRLSL